jgi:hypothetical protein
MAKGDPSVLSIKKATISTEIAAFLSLTILLLIDVTHLDFTHTLCRFASKSCFEKIFGRSFIFAPRAQK